MGGSGKTPHTEYLIRLLAKNHTHVALLSRGYGRQTKGFRFVDSISTSKEVGDEPLLMYKKHTSVAVAVCENRIRGLHEITAKLPDTDVVLLDDAYQYLPLKPGLSLLLTDYYSNYVQDYVVPIGKLREGRSAAKDADIIIVTKSPKTIPSIEEKMIIRKIKPLPSQKVYFSYIEFDAMSPLTQKAKEMSADTVRSVVAVCGIANPYPFLEYIKHRYIETQQLVFSDHHCFTLKDVQKMSKYVYRSMYKHCAVVTTEKDVVRLIDPKLQSEVEKLPVFYIPIKVKFHPKYEAEFEERILDYVRENRINS
jgi:tetraacyldisaccharide 4'-kinase